METQTQAYSTVDAPAQSSDDSDVHRGAVAVALRSKGTSILAWSRAHRWAHQTVYQVIERWIEDPSRRGRMPLGGVSRAIYMALQTELGTDVVPRPDGGDRPALERAA